MNHSWFKICCKFLVFILIHSPINCQRNYDVILENVEQDGPDNALINWDLFISKYNWTTNTMEGSIAILDNIPLDTTVHSIGYERRNNRYQESHVNILMNICDFLNETHVKTIFLEASDFPRTCSVLTKGNYTVSHMTVLSENLPKDMAGKYWMMRFIVQSNTNVLGDLKLYARIERARPALHQHIN